MISRISASIAGRSSSVNGPRRVGREVVIEAVVGRRAEGDLRAGEQRLHRLGQHVRVVVARQFERVGLVARGDQREAARRPRTGGRGRAARRRPARRAPPWRGPGRSPRRRRPGSCPRGTSRTEPSGRLILNISDIVTLSFAPARLWHRPRAPEGAASWVSGVRKETPCRPNPDGGAAAQRDDRSAPGDPGWW